MSIEDDIEARPRRLSDHTDRQNERSKKRAVAIFLVLFVVASCIAILATAYLLTMFDFQNVALIIATITGMFVLVVLVGVVNRLNGQPVPQRFLITVGAVATGVAVGIVILYLGN